MKEEEKQVEALGNKASPDSSDIEENTKFN
jgi:hypothetical protein